MDKELIDYIIEYYQEFLSLEEKAMRKRLFIAPNANDYEHFKRRWPKKYYVNMATKSLLINALNAVALPELHLPSNADTADMTGIRDCTQYLQSKI